MKNKYVGKSIASRPRDPGSPKLRLVQKEQKMLCLGGNPWPTNSGVREGLVRGALHKNEQIIISLLVGGGYPPNYVFRR